MLHKREIVTENPVEVHRGKSDDEASNAVFLFF